MTRPGRDLVGQCRIDVAVGPALGIGRHGERALADGQVGARIVQGVVAGRRQRSLNDSVDADILAVVAGVRPPESVSPLTRPGRHLVRQRWIGIAVGAALGIGRHGERALADGQVGARKVQRVVAGRRERALDDAVGADILAVVAGSRPPERLSPLTRPVVTW